MGISFPSISPKYIPTKLSLFESALSKPKKGFLSGLSGILSLFLGLITFIVTPFKLFAKSFFLKIKI